MSVISQKNFSQIDLGSEFFDSLRNDYIGFNEWFSKKANDGSSAYVLNDNGKLMAFLYLKVETGEVADVLPKLPPKRRLKVGTFKVDPHGTRLGERFLKIAIDRALKEDVEEIYVTAFEKHENLIKLFESFGFQALGTKTSVSGTEQVFVKNPFDYDTDPTFRYPLLDLSSSTRVYSVGIKPEYHTKLFPDSKLNTENPDEYIQDVSHTNGIYKNYIGAMWGLANLRLGDIVAIYRTKDYEAANAYYSSVWTSICTVLETRSVTEFKDFDDFYHYCKPYSVLSKSELLEKYEDKKSVVATMLYNVAFKKRLTNKYIQGLMGKPNYWGFFGIPKEKLETIIEASGVDKRLFWRG